MLADQVSVVDALRLHSSEEGNRRKLGGTTPTWGFLHRSCVICCAGRVTCETLRFHKRASIVWGRVICRLGKRFPEMTSG